MTDQSSSDDEPDTPPGLTPADKAGVDIEDFPKPVPVTMDDMIDFCITEALRIRGTQATLIACGHRTIEDPGMIRRAEVAEAQARFLEAIKPILPEIRKMKRRK